MNGAVVARVRRVVRGHSERTLVHAVDEAGLEHKIEVPSEAVQNLAPGQELTLTLTWTLEPATPSSTPPNLTPPARAPTPLPTAVDEEFMALMARRRGASPTAPGQSNQPVTGPPLSTAEELARRLGIPRGRTSS